MPRSIFIFILFITLGTTLFGPSKGHAVSNCEHAQLQSMQSDDLLMHPLHQQHSASSHHDKQDCCNHVCQCVEGTCASLIATFSSIPNSDIGLNIAGAIISLPQVAANGLYHTPFRPPILA